MTIAEMDHLRWQCRRGLLELDYLLEAFLEREFPCISAQEQEAFVTLLSCDDPDLQVWLLGDKYPKDPALVMVVERLRAMRL